MKNELMRTVVEGILITIILWLASVVGFIYAYLPFPEGCWYGSVYGIIFWMIGFFAAIRQEQDRDNRRLK